MDLEGKYQGYRDLEGDSEIQSFGGNSYRALGERL